jgi:hypothetical protein
MNDSIMHVSKQFLPESYFQISFPMMMQPLPYDDLNFHELALRIRPPGLDMQPGDFRHITMRESYRTTVKEVWLATNATPGAWDQLAVFVYPVPLDMSLNAQEDRRRFGELARVILEHAGPYGGGDEEGLAFMALRAIMIPIARHGWQGYMELEIAKHAAAAAAGPFIPAPVPLAAALPPELLPAN